MKKNRRKQNRKDTKKTGLLKNKWMIGGLFLVLFIFLFFSPSIKYDFVNWDDDINITENENVTDFDVNGIFSDHVIGNYNPLTIFSFAAEYQLVGEKPALYHFNNVLLHTICTLLVFVLMQQLGMSFLVSFLVALLFGVHPMRVESVIWITERKDVLFGLFYLVSLLFYVKYVKNKRPLFFILSLGIFVLSLLSKIQAVALPLSVVLIDYWFQRKPDRKLILEKIPFFALSLATGLVGVYFLRQQGSLETGTIYPLYQRLFIGSYSFMVYIVKSVVPWQMSALYPYPKQLSAMFYLSMLPALAIAAVPIFTFKTNRHVTFGLLFFIFNIVFLLQIVGAGQGFIADRFSYIPYIGLFIIYARAIDVAGNKLYRQRSLIYTLLAVYLVILTVVTYQRMKVWENSETLWTDVIKKYPKVALAYNNLGHYFRQKDENEKALVNYNKALELDDENALAYSNRGKIYFDRGETQKAIADYTKSLEYQPNDAAVLANRGAAFGMNQEWQKALVDLNKSLELDPDNLNALSNRGIVYYQLKEFDKNIEDYHHYLQLKPNDADIINTIGLCFRQLNEVDKAIAEFSRAIQINPNGSAFYLNRSLAYNAKGEFQQALQDAIKAQQLGQSVNPNYIEFLKNKQS